MHRLPCAVLVALTCAAPPLEAQTRIRIMPPERATLAVEQRFDVRVEATSAGPDAPRGLAVTIDGRDVTVGNLLDPGAGGVRGAGGTGSSDAALPSAHRASAAPPHTANFLLRDFSFTRAGAHVIEARTADGATARVTLHAEAWQGTRRGAARARNIILFLGDGMGSAHRTAARLISRGVTAGKARSLLAMDTMPVAGQVMTASLNSVITDSAPGMSSYANGQKGSNNQAGVYPDNTANPFDNPRAEYIGAMLRRLRGPGFNVGIVTTADVTDATPAGNAVYTADRNAGPGIAARFFDERHASGVTVLMGGGARHFLPRGAGSSRTDARDLAAEFAAAGYMRLSTRTELRRLLDAPQPPSRVLGLFHPRHLAVAFDKVGAGRYSRELGLEKNAALRDQPLLDEMTKLALASLAAHSPAGFYLMVEGASVDKQSHSIDAERTVWDTIELDNAVRVALDFAARTNADADPLNDTLVIVTADHETGGLALVGVGNERFAPGALGTAVRDYAAVFRFDPEQTLNFIPNYEVDAQGYPLDPDPARKLLLGWAAAPDHFENWISNRVAQDGAVAGPADGTSSSAGPAAVANPRRDGPSRDSDNQTVSGRAIPGFLVTGTIENGAVGCPQGVTCPDDTAAVGHTISGHTGSDVPLSAAGAGAWQFTGTFENTDVFVRMLRAAAGSYPAPGTTGSH